MAERREHIGPLPCKTPRYDLQNGRKINFTTEHTEIAEKNCWFFEIFNLGVLRDLCG